MKRVAAPVKRLKGRARSEWQRTEGELSPDCRHTQRLEVPGGMGTISSGTGMRLLPFGAPLVVGSGELQWRALCVS